MFQASYAPIASSPHDREPSESDLFDLMSTSGLLRGAGARKSNQGVYQGVYDLRCRIGVTVNSAGLNRLSPPIS